MSLQSELERFYKTDRYKQLLREAVQTNPNLGQGNGGVGTEQIALDAASDLKDMLNASINKVKASNRAYPDNFKNRFYDQFDTAVYFENGTGWVIDLSFSDGAARGESLYPEGGYEPVYLPKLFNDGWNADGTVFGYWPRAGKVVPSKSIQEQTKFVDRAVNEFNGKYRSMGIVAYIHPIYHSSDYEFDDINQAFEIGF